MFYLFLAVSLGAVVAAVRVRGAPAERARLLSAAVMTLLAVAFILRAPVVARIGGVIGPPAVLAAWAWHRYAHWRLLRGALAFGAIATLAIAGEWRGSAYRIERNGPRLGEVLSDAAATPPDALLAKQRLTGLVRYVRRCTQPDDRVFAAWFVRSCTFSAAAPLPAGWS